MRNGGLSQLHALLDIARTEAGFLVERASAFFFQRLQNSAAGGIGDGVQEAIEVGGMT